MRIEDFDYQLPEELIARYPAERRRDARLLVVGEQLEDRRFAELPSRLRPGDLLVINDTKVIPARLHGRKETGGRIELLIERVTDEREALAHVRASKSPKPGTRLLFAEGIEAEVLDRDGGLFRLRFSASVADALDARGEVPLPPYLEREAEDSDIERYQTVYASKPGAVAAPTAGLHFDDELLDELSAAGIGLARVTLHVGAGTFQNLREEDVRRKELHSERVIVTEDCVEQVAATRARGGRVVAVGTTSVRSLESAAASGELGTFDGETTLFIQPGYDFRVVDLMITNFHLPKSSLMMLVSAFAGRERVLDAYRHAVESRYRFFSYGDSMLLSPAPAA